MTKNETLEKQEMKKNETLQKQEIKENQELVKEFDTKTHLNHKNNATEPRKDSNGKIQRFFF